MRNLILIIFDDIRYYNDHIHVVIKKRKLEARLFFSTDVSNTNNSFLPILFCLTNDIVNLIIIFIVRSQDAS